MPFCDIDTDVKPYLGIPLSNTDYDSLLTLWRDAVEAAMLQYTEATFVLTAVTEVLDASRADQVVPAEYPIDSVQALYFYVLPDGTSGELIDTDRYQVKQGGVILQHLYTPKGRALVRLDYTYGYDGVPADVKLGILIAIRAEYHRWQDKAEGRSRTSRSKKDESEAFSSNNPLTSWDSKTGLPIEAVNKFKPYKRFEFATQPIAQRNL